MPKVYDENGNELSDVFTKEEMEQAQSRIQELEKGGLTQEEREELEKLRKKDFNWANLRRKKQSDGQQNDADDADDDADNDGQGEQQKQTKPPAQQKKATVSFNDDEKKILSEAGVQDDSMKSVVGFYFERLAGQETDPAIRAHMLNQAIGLARNEKPNQGGMGVNYSSAGASGAGGTRQGDESHVSKTIGKEVFGLDDNARASYGAENWDPFRKQKSGYRPDLGQMMNPEGGGMAGNAK